MNESPKMLFPSKGEWLQLIAVVCLATVVAYSCNSFVNYFVAYTNTPSDTFSASVDSLHPSTGFRKIDNLCLNADDIEARINKLSRIVETHVCRSYAHFLCHKRGTIWFELDTLLRELHQNLDDTALLRNMTMQNTGVILDERTNVNGEKELKCPEIRANRYKPYSCLLREWVSEHAKVVILSCLTATGLGFVGVKLRKKRYLESRADEVYEQICEILEENALSSRSKNGEHETWVAASWLRDHLLLPNERRQHVLWKKIEQLVQEDSRIDVFQNLVKGESKLVWEWQVEGSLSWKRVRNVRALRSSSSERSEAKPHRLQERST